MHLGQALQRKVGEGHGGVVAVYSVCGKLGVGKSKFAVWKAQEALRDGRRVAGNLDLFQPLTPERALCYTRIPDKPTAFDLEAMGHGNPDSYDEDRNGDLFLDELGTWLNARSFQDKARAGMIDWLIHARKHGWNVWLIVQDEGMIDKQVREALVEYSVRVMRMDKVRWPLLLGKIAGALGGIFRRKRWGYFPRFHMATARVGYGAGAIVAERWMFRGDELHAAYNTRQVFSPDYPHGTFSALPSWEWRQPHTRLQQWLAAVRRGLARPPSPPVKPKLVAVARMMHLPAGVRLQAMRDLQMALGPSRLPRNGPQGFSQFSKRKRPKPTADELLRRLRAL